MADELLTDLRDGVLLATLNRPEAMNSMNAELLHGLNAAIERASEDDDVRALVLTGTGRAFCAGASITPDGDPTRGGGQPSRRQRMDRLGPGATVLAFANCDVPIIAAINGAAVGGGFGLAMCCDVRFMGASGRIGTIFPKRGIAADYGASYWLPRIVGISQAYHLFYQPDLLNAEDALAAGVVDQVVSDDKLLDETLAYAGKIAAGPPLAYTTVRRLLMRSGELPMVEFLKLEWSSQRELLSTKDAGEGFKSFIEKRDPVFTGE